jgi:hypothetical protein
MVQEDRAHAKNALKPFEQLSKKEQIRELIFQLRDQNGHQFSQPDFCDIIDTFSGKVDTPAHRLVKLSTSARRAFTRSAEAARTTIGWRISTPILKAQ